MAFIIGVLVVFFLRLKMKRVRVVRVGRGCVKFHLETWNEGNEDVGWVSRGVGVRPTWWVGIGCDRGGHWTGEDSVTVT
jgi:hypothetical protein